MRECPKCGWANLLAPRYCKAQYEDCGEYSNREHLHYACPRCEYNGVVTLCLDAKEQANG